MELNQLHWRDYPGAKMQTKFIKQHFLITLDGIVENYIISSTRKVIKTRRKEKVKKKKQQAVKKKHQHHN